jgi:hypothetical protein
LNCFEGELDVWQSPRKLGKAWRNPKLDHGRRGSDRDFPAWRFEQIGGAMHELGKRRLHVGQPGLALCRQDNPARLAAEQLRTQPQFEVLNSLAHGGLGEPEFATCRGETPEPSRSFENPDPFERR